MTPWNNSDWPWAINLCYSEKMYVSYCYKWLHLIGKQIRAARSNDDRTRAWKNVKQATEKIKKLVATYRRCRRAMQRLGATEEDLNIYKLLLPADVQLSADVVEPNRVGQRNDQLAWFWHLGQQNNEQNVGLMDECRF